ncbi:MAG: efflux RND transporter periplasmic adaptor subunit [Chlamydiae bacterium]|nr:efflux RND transporter periplasmic adaptor subunit [Chlamydiota bacterium]
MRYLACIFIGCVLVSCEKPVKKEMGPVPVSVIRVEPQTIPADFEYIGVGQSSHIVEIRARVEGYLESIDYREGSMVQKGDLLFVLDQRPFQATVDSALGTLERQKAVLWNAQQVKNRMVPLYSQHAVSQRDLDDAIARELAASANVQTAAADLNQAQLNLGFASILAPVTALSSQAKYREGALINPGSENLLTTLYVVDPIWVNFSISESDILKIKRNVANKKLAWPKEMNFQVEAILSDGTILPGEGLIDFTNPALQQSTGTMLIRAVLPNPKLLIYPGQFVRAVVKGAMRPDAILVPQTAVQQGDPGTFVYVVEGGKAVMRPVVAGDWYQDSWIIDSGLSSGDLVITQGVNRVQNHTPVAIQSLIPGKPAPGTIP